MTMKKKIITLDNTLAKELESYPNQSEIVREALRVYMEYISPEVIVNLRKTFKIIDGRLANIEQSIETIAKASNVSIDKHSEWGA